MEWLYLNLEYTVQQMPRLLILEAPILDDLRFPFLFHLSSDAQMKKHLESILLVENVLFYILLD